jgi:hypothetical protein
MRSLARRSRRRDFVAGQLAAIGVPGPVIEEVTGAARRLGRATIPSADRSVVAIVLRDGPTGRLAVGFVPIGEQ